MYCSWAEACSAPRSPSALNATVASNLFMWMISWFWRRLRQTEGGEMHVRKVETSAGGMRVLIHVCTLCANRVTAMKGKSPERMRR